MAYEKGGMAEKFYARWEAVAQPAARQLVDWGATGSTLDVHSLHSEVRLNKILSTEWLPGAAH